MKNILYLLLVVLIIGCKKDKADLINGSYVYSHIVFEPNEIYSKNYFSNSQTEIQQYLIRNYQNVGYQNFKNSELSEIEKNYTGTGFEIVDNKIKFSNNGVSVKTFKFTRHNNIYLFKSDTITIGGDSKIFGEFNKIFMYPREIISNSVTAFGSTIKYFENGVIKQNDEGLYFPNFGYVFVSKTPSSFSGHSDRYFNNDVNPLYINSGNSYDTLVVIKYKAVFKKK